MGFFEAARVALFQKYATFQGRASRSEFWKFYLFIFLVNVALDIYVGVEGISVGTLTLLIAFLILTILPSLACTVRRLHDTDRSGWWLLISFVPVVGMVLVIWMFHRGTLGTNRFGEDPIA